ncbi:potassium channel family protein [Gammaproteobacteria bacterium]|nr:potassium channel family protein [Gammaproteobacteria bacterium]
MLGGQLLLGTFLIVTTAMFHVICLVGLAALLNRIDPKPGFESSKPRMIYLMGIAVLVIIGVHTVEAWAWAGVYYFLGEFTDLANALYFSVVTVTTLGYGDIILSERWQLLASFEAMGGIIFFGASTAFLIGVIQHMFHDAASIKKK